MSYKKFVLATALGLSFGFPVASWAEDKPDKAPDSKKAPGDALSPEVRKHLSEMYQKMGDCLAKTDKSMQDCQREVMKNCPVPKELGFCPLEDGIKPMNGKHTGMDHSKMKMRM